MHDIDIVRLSSPAYDHASNVVHPDETRREAPAASESTPKISKFDEFHSWGWYGWGEPDSVALAPDQRTAS